MDDRVVWMDSLGRLTRRLVVEGNEPVELAITLGESAGLVGNLYLARVMNVLGGMHAAFVDIGMAKNAFLSLDDLPSVVRQAGDVSAPRRAVKAGQSVIVQVVKEPGGDKGPRVSMNVTLPGQLVVLLPTVQTVGVSRQIEEETQRAALQALGEAICPEGMGLILRTAAEGADAALITAEVQALADEWRSLAAFAEARKPPSLLRATGDLKASAIRDLAVEAVQEGPIPDTLETKLQKALRRKVWLDSGAYLVIDHTEALTVIDVNSGKFTGKRSLAETLLRLNTEAAIEIARQIRLRDLGGILLIDFVDMETDADRAAVLAAFEAALAHDRGKRHIHGFTGTGLLEMTRRPVVRPLRQAMPAALAEAAGLCLEVRRRRAAGDESEIVLQASPEAAAAVREIGVPEGARLIAPKEKEKA